MTATHVSVFARILALLIGAGALLTSPLAQADNENQDSVVAELWPFEVPVGEPSKPVFEQWRSQVPPAEFTVLPLESLTIPARATSSMVRVVGNLVAPQSGKYDFRIIGLDEAEMWLADNKTGEWKLVQRKGNPNPRSGRTTMEMGEARRFEFWTMGEREISVLW